jgi:hypothetical protein
LKAIREATKKRWAAYRKARGLRPRPKAPEALGTKKAAAMLTA